MPSTHAWPRSCWRFGPGPAADPDTRCIVLTGAGERAFCAGADLKERDGMSEQDWHVQHDLFERMAYALMDCPNPVIAAVNGAAYAGGFEMVLAADFAYGVPTARFALTEVTLGLIPGVGGTQNLPRAVGLRRAKEMLLTGRPMGADQARDWGVLNRICDRETLLAEALATAKQIAGNAPLAVRQAMAAMDGGIDMPLAEGRRHEIACYNTLVDTDDRREGDRGLQPEAQTGLQRTLARSSVSVRSVIAAMMSRCAESVASAAWSKSALAAAGSLR